MANTQTLALSSPHLLAEYVRQSDLQSFFEKRLAAPPDHVAILIRNGEVLDAYKGAHFSIGGLFDGLRKLVVGSTHVRILLGDLKPFSLQSPVRAMTRDKVEVAGTVTLELQVNPDKPQNVMGLVNAAGFLTRDEVLERFRPHLTDRVFEATIGRVDAGELRGDRGLQDKLQGDVMREIERIAGDIGLMVRALSVEWALNEVEREAMRASQLDRAQDGLDTQLNHLKRSVERNFDATEVQFKTDLDVAKLQIEGDDEISRLALQKEVEFLDSRETSQRRQEMEALAHEIEVLSTERTARIENELADAGQTIDLMRYERALNRVRNEIDAMKQTHLAEMRKVGAFSELEIEERRRQLDLDLSDRAQKQSLEHIAGLQSIEKDSDAHEARLRPAELDSLTRRDVERVRADTDARVAQLQAGANMTPEQILAINAGLSSDVAAVLAEQARSQATGKEETMSMMREMVTQATDARVASETQAREMFQTAMEGAVGVARGAGGKSSGDSAGGGGGGTKARTVECASCGRENDSKARFCVGCGKQLRS